jgi:hypothetical protein
MAATTDEQAPPAEAAAPDAAATSATEPATATVPRTRVRVGELISAASALLLLVIMFATEWYGVAGVPDPSAARPAVSTAENGWNGLTTIRWVLLITILVAIGSVFLRASQRKHGAKTETGGVVAALGAVSSVLLVYRVLIALPAGTKVIDQKLGAFMGLVCALGVAWGGYESIVARRAHSGGGSRRTRRRSRLSAGGRER